jgi:hypothetical protein
MKFISCLKTVLDSLATFDRYESRYRFSVFQPTSIISYRYGKYAGIFQDNRLSESFSMALLVSVSFMHCLKWRYCRFFFFFTKRSLNINRDDQDNLPNNVNKKTCCWPLFRFLFSEGCILRQLCIIFVKAEAD